MIQSTEYHDKEMECQLTFQRLGRCFHLWTPENFEIIFTCDDDYKKGMDIIGVCALACPEIRILTFELMSNHFHSTICGEEADIIHFFVLVKNSLIKVLRLEGRILAWDNFHEKHRQLADLNEMRNVIIYNNRNGYLVSPDHTPFTYPWGANKYYFNPDSVRIAEEHSMQMTLREKRDAIRSHMADSISGPIRYDGYAFPPSFCDIKSGEQLFHNASNYFHRLSRSIEWQKGIADEIGESVFYTDDELFSIVCRMAKENYNVRILSSLPSSGKIELAKVMHFEYNASAKQIMRMLKLSFATLSSLGIID